MIGYFSSHSNDSFIGWFVILGIDRAVAMTSWRSTSNKRCDPFDSGTSFRAEISTTIFQIVRILANHGRVGRGMSGSSRAVLRNTKRDRI